MMAYPDREQSETPLEISGSLRNVPESEACARFHKSALPSSITLDDLTHSSIQAVSNPMFSCRFLEEDAKNRSTPPQEAIFFKTIEQALAWLEERETGESESSYFLSVLMDSRFFCSKSQVYLRGVLEKSGII